MQGEQRFYRDVSYVNTVNRREHLPPAQTQPVHIPMAAFAARAAWEAQQKADALQTHAKFLYYRHKFPQLMQDPDEY